MLWFAIAAAAANFRTAVFAGLDTHRRVGTVAMADRPRCQGAYIGDVQVSGASTGPLQGLTAVVKVRLIAATNAAQ